MKHNWDKLKNMAQRFFRRERKVTRVPAMEGVSGGGFIIEPSYAVDFSLIGDVSKAPHRIGPGRVTLYTLHRSIAKSWRIGHQPGVLAGYGERQRKRRNALFMRRAYERRYGVQRKFSFPKVLLKTWSIPGGKTVVFDEAMSMIQRRASLSMWTEKRV